ncbi:GyrI-like domain-containing protein [Pedobacter cryoconitis]|uniref:AraC family transcriptional regulator n=1 Tax=Pedobacter cryoconitis TaxID=188932 RepID=A0A7X0J1S9_9SPHI|nr:AraC family transcriptional regulator [Pedobacter cryoconitis]MBB6498877.1 AraC family transcriptional regulator [Pedobacter cryoconitis]
MDAVNLKCIYNTLTYIESNYDRQLSIKELEEVSNYSYRNIQRIFSYTCGETIGAYQKKRRVENAYKKILYTKENLTTIALQVGFANLASFSKAFKQHFGISPKEAKSGKVSLLTDTNVTPVISTILLKPEIIYLPARHVYYESTFTNYVNEDIEVLWDKFMENEFPATGVDYFGIIVDEPLIREKISCRYDACSSVQSGNQKLASKMILGGRYARFLHTGNYETIDETYEKIYSGWILNSNLEFAHTPMIECYLKYADHTNSDEDQLTAILLPLK